MYSKLVRPKQVTVFNGNWRSLDWASVYRECASAQKVATETELASLVSAHERLVARKLAEASAGGLVLDASDLEERYPYPSLPYEVSYVLKRKASNIVMEEFVERYRIKDFSIGMLSEMLKHISTYKLSNLAGEDYNPKSVVIEYDEDGKVLPMAGMISVTSLYKSMFTDDTMMGVYNFLMMDSRATYLEKQYLGASRAYCSLVPLIMYAFKFHRNVPYSHWDISKLEGIVNPKLLEAMWFRTDVSFTNEEIMEARTQGLLVKTGKTAGQIRNPLYTYKLFGAALFKGVPELVQTMLAQIWCAHPSNRTKYMILDYNQWDNVPASLVADSPVAEYIPRKPIVSDDPWA